MAAWGAAKEDVRAWPGHLAAWRHLWVVAMILVLLAASLFVPPFTEFWAEGAAAALGAALALLALAPASLWGRCRQCLVVLAVGCFTLSAFALPSQAYGLEVAGFLAAAALLFAVRLDDIHRAAGALLLLAMLPALRDEFTAPGADLAAMATFGVLLWLVWLGTSERAPWRAVLSAVAPVVVVLQLWVAYGVGSLGEAVPELVSAVMWGVLVVFWFLPAARQRVLRGVLPLRPPRDRMRIDTAAWGRGYVASGAALGIPGLLLLFLLLGDLGWSDPVAPSRPGSTAVRALLVAAGALGVALALLLRRDGGARWEAVMVSSISVWTWGGFLPTQWVLWAVIPAVLGPWLLVALRASGTARMGGFVLAGIAALWGMAPHAQDLDRGVGWASLALLAAFVLYPVVAWRRTPPEDAWGVRLLLLSAAFAAGISLLFLTSFLVRPLLHAAVWAACGAAYAAAVVAVTTVRMPRRQKDVEATRPS